MPDFRRLPKRRAIRWLLATLGADAERVSWSVARTGTVYAYGEHVSVRISDHACRAGAYSHDGRTAGYTLPDIDLRWGAPRAAVESAARALLAENEEDASAAIEAAEEEAAAQEARRHAAAVERLRAREAARAEEARAWDAAWQAAIDSLPPADRARYENLRRRAEEAETPRARKRLRNRANAIVRAHMESAG